MLKWIAKKIVGTKNQREINHLMPIVGLVNEWEETMAALTDEQLRAKTEEYKERIGQDVEGGVPLPKALDRLLPEAFAVVREAGRRSLGMRHYDVQILGGIVLHQGKITEMKTGEGKTLVATLPVYLNALAGKGVHVITVNDYLAERDADWMGKIYRFLGMQVGVVTHSKSNEERKVEYGADITYGTNNEFGFDYLRDNMKYNLEDYVQRDQFYAIVDEVDSILIDEARTPLIISGPTELNTDKYYFINEKVKALIDAEKALDTDPTQDPKEGENPGRYYQLDLEHRSAVLTEEGVHKMEEILEIENLYAPSQLDTVHYVQQAVNAHTLYQLDVQYVVNDGKVIIVDEFTGRLMDGRRWSDGLHQAVEAKEGVQIENENQTLATITFQNYFKMYDKLAGMTGTAETEAAEFHSIYELDVIVIPTNEPLIRDDKTDLIFKRQEYKLKAVIEDVKSISEAGAPVLIGTTSVDASEIFSRALIRGGVRHEVLNAKQHEREAEIIAQAGKTSAVTIATNMAGRGTDIVLGGNPEYYAWTKLISLGYDRSSLLGDQFIRAILMGNDALVEEMLANNDDFTRELVEDIRTHQAEQKADQQRVLDAGGLHIIGTERHESRRVDNQLRGRAGRQGDPGASRFYLSLEDDLIKIFGGEKVVNIMERLGMEDEAIEHNMLNRSIEGAQKRVEARNFEIRKNLLEYDDVMSTQRETIYDERRAILGREDLRSRVEDLAKGLLDDWIERAVPRKSYPEDWDWEMIEEELFAVTGQKFVRPDEEILENYNEEMLTEELDKLLMGIIDKKADEFGPDVFEDFLQFSLLQVLDDLWRDHLLAMDQLREGIGLRGYGQKDPKREYQREGFSLFSMLIALYRREVMLRVAHVQLARETLNLDISALEREGVQEGFGSEAALAPPPLASQPALTAPGIMPDGTIPDLSSLQAAQADPLSKVQLPRQVGKKVKPNEPCPCGSGKKYKQCHGKRA